MQSKQSCKATTLNPKWAFPEIGVPLLYPKSKRNPLKGPPPPNKKKRVPQIEKKSLEGTLFQQGYPYFFGNPPESLLKAPWPRRGGCEALEGLRGFRFQGLRMFQGLGSKSVYLFFNLLT